MVEFFLCRRWFFLVKEAINDPTIFLQSNAKGIVGERSRNFSRATKED
jgi:hypothetical protein